MDVTKAAEMVASVGAALAAIAGVLALVNKFFIHKISDQIEVKLSAVQRDIASQISEKTKQLRPNGGSHLIDTVNQIADRQIAIEARVQRVEYRTRKLTQEEY